MIFICAIRKTASALRIGIRIGDESFRNSLGELSELVLVKTLRQVLRLVATNAVKPYVPRVWVNLVNFLASECYAK